MTENTNILNLTANMVAAYVGNNALASKELPDLIRNVHGALMASMELESEVDSLPSKPAVPIGKSVFEDHIICLEDGQKFKSLKRHLRAKYDMSPDEYRQKWGLAGTYPMVAPEYARTRSALARQNGLGRHHKKET
ncbi:MAG: MucR family transcriptional regulator [Robiginitomaculum sp.]|nr:MucR family transcriptional regulator [Robiginitomaculum sp.]